jgi:hypothetical protein
MADDFTSSRLIDSQTPLCFHVYHHCIQDLDSLVKFRRHLVVKHEAHAPANISASREESWYICLEFDGTLTCSTMTGVHMIVSVGDAGIKSRSSSSYFQELLAVFWRSQSSTR